MVTGVLDSDDEDDPMLKAILSFHIHSEPVLEEVFDFVRDAFRKNESDGYTLDDMLDDAGIVTDDE